MTTFYFAYGANTNVQSMIDRCPAAIQVGRGELDGYKLTFRGVASIEPTDGSMHGAVWAITRACERALDKFEGYPYLYVKRRVKVRVNGRVIECMVYVMNGWRRDREHPSPYYHATLRQGYRDFQMPYAQINAALREVDAWIKANPRPAFRLEACERRA